MRRHAWLMTVALATGVVACGSDESAVTTTTVAPTTTAAGSALAEQLLTVDELVGVDGEWTAVTDMSPSDMGSLGESPCPDGKLADDIVERLRPTDAVIFEPSDSSMRGVQELILSGDAAQLEADLTAVFGSSESCMGEQYEVPGSGEKVQYEMVTAPELGDQRIVTRITAFEPPDFTTTWRGHMAVVRVGGVAIMLNEFEILDSPDTPAVMTDDAFVELLQAAVAKISG